MPHRMHTGPASDGHDENRDDQDNHGERDDAGQGALTSDDYLTGERITPTRLAPDMTVADLLDGSFQAYNAGRINEAARLASPPRSRLPKPGRDRDDDAARVAGDHLELYAWNELSSRSATVISGASRVGVMRSTVR